MTIPNGDVIVPAEETVAYIIADVVTPGVEFIFNSKLLPIPIYPLPPLIILMFEIVDDAETVAVNAAET